MRGNSGKIQVDEELSNEEKGNDPRLLFRPSNWSWVCSKQNAHEQVLHHDENDEIRSIVVIISVEHLRKNRRCQCQVQWREHAVLNACTHIRMTLCLRRQPEHDLDIAHAMELAR